MRARSSLALLVGGLLAAGAFTAGCATTGGAASANVPALAAPPVERSAPAPELTALVESLYRPGAEAPLALLKTQTRTILAKHPHAWEAHEVAGYLARLDGDENAAWHHFLHAAADLRARDGVLYLTEALTHSRTLSQTRAEMEVLQALSSRHPDAVVRDHARAYLIGDLRRLGRVEEAEAVLQTLPHLSQWRVAGAFDNDQGKGFLTPFPPEDRVDLEAEMQGSRLPVRWRAVPRLSPWGNVPMDDLVSPSDWSIAYLVTWVTSPSERDVDLRISTGAPVRAWVNGQLVLDEARIESFESDNVTTRIRLDAGANRLLIKSAHETDGWTLRARLTDAAGRALPDLVESKDPLTVKEREAGTAAPARIFPYDEASVDDSPRSLFLRERYLSRSGRPRDAIDAARALLDALPGNRLAELRAAALYLSTGEAGRSIDLLNRVVDETDGAVPAFLLRRATFFQTKDQLDRAQDDLLRVLEKHPDLMRARMSLATTFARRGWTVDRCRQIDEVLARWPDSAWAVRSKASCLRARGLTREADEQLQVALDLEPGSYETLSELFDRALETTDFEKARAYGREMLRLSLTSPTTRLRLARLERVAGDRARSRQLLEEARGLDPDDARPYRELGDLAYEDGDTDRAVAQWNLSLERDPRDSSLSDHVDYVASEGLGLLERFAPGQDAIDKAIENGRAHPPRPGTQTALLLDHEVTEIKNDGSSKALVTIVRMAVTKQGQDALIKTRVPMSRTKLLRAYSITPDGARQEASSIRGGEVRFRNPEIGTITVVQYVTHRRSGAFLPNHFVASWSFQGVLQEYRDSTWVVITPPERTLNIKVVGDVKQTEEKVNGSVARTFRATDVPPLVPERFMPPAHDLVWRVELSTVKGWDEYVSWERALLKNAFRSNAELEALAVKLTDGLSDPRARFDRLFHYVAQEIRYQQDYESTIAGVRPHACPVVLERGYGDCKDKAVLLILLAQRVGIDVDFAILRTLPAGAVDKEIPNQQFNHAIVYVPPQAGFPEGTFFDPTTDGLDMGNLRSDDQGATSLVLDPDSGKWQFLDIPYQAPEAEKSRWDIEMTLGEGGKATSRVRGNLRGGLASSLRQGLRDEETAKTLFQRLSSLFYAGSTLIEGGPDGEPEDIYQPLQLHMDLDTDGSIHATPEGTRIDVPLFFPLSQAVGRKERELPIVLGIPRILEMDVGLELPAGRKVASPPPDFQVEHACFTAARKTEVTKTRVDVRFRFEQRCARIEPEGYEEFREAARQVIRHERDTLLLAP